MSWFRFVTKINESNVTPCELYNYFDISMGETKFVITYHEDILQFARLCQRGKCYPEIETVGKTKLASET